MVRTELLSATSSCPTATAMGSSVKGWAGEIPGAAGSEAERRPGRRDEVRGALAARIGKETKRFVLMDEILFGTTKETMGFPW